MIKPEDIATQIDNLKKYQTFDEVIELVKKHYIVSDPRAIKVAVAGIVSHYFTSDPLWIFLIAPPSSMKTEIISAFDDIKDIYQLSSLTAQTLFSGLRKTKGQVADNALLSKIGDKILTLKDFGTVLSMRYEDRAVVLSQLREVYDGSFHARYGNGVEIDWKGRIGFIAGVTPIIDTHYSIFQTLGERFIQFRLPAVDERELGVAAIKALGHEKVQRKELKDAFASFISNLKIPDMTAIEVSDEIIECLVSLASFVVRARSGTVRDNYRHTLEYIPDPEAPARLAKQLTTLCCALAIIDKREKVSLFDYLVTLKVGLDCIPQQRMTVLNFLSSSPMEEFATGKVAEATDYSREGITVHLEDLVAHKLLNINKQGQGRPDLWHFSERTFKYLAGMLPSTDTNGILENMVVSPISNYGKLFHLIQEIHIEEGKKSNYIHTLCSSCMRLASRDIEKVSQNEAEDIFNV